MEALLRTGARNVSQIDELLRAAEDESDSESPFRVVRILLATQRNSVLEHFLNKQGLCLLHRWLSEWSSVETIECLKLLRQLPVTKEQLTSNADLCRRLRKISKSNADANAAVIAKEVVEQWKAEVLGGRGDLFHREEKSHKENADKHSEINQDAEPKKVVEIGRKLLKIPTKSGSSGKTSSVSMSSIRSSCSKNIFEG